MSLEEFYTKLSPSEIALRDNFSVSTNDLVLFKTKAWIDYKEERKQDTFSIVERRFYHNEIEINQRLLVVIGDLSDYALDQKLVKDLNKTGKTHVVLDRYQGSKISVGEFLVCLSKGLDVLREKNIDIKDNYYSIRYEI